MADSLNKTAVAQFLEAVKSSLNHLSQLKMEMGETGRRPADLTEKHVMQMYSRVRRIREYLRRWMSAYPTPEEISLGDEDKNLLVSCLVFELNRADKAVAAEQMKANEDVGWLEKRKEILSTWIVELATKAVEQLPSLFRAEVNYEVRQVLVAVRDKFAPKTQSTASGIYQLGVQKSGPTVARGVGVTAATTKAMTASEPSIVETSRVRDYRLRLTMIMDLKAYQRCSDAEDYRLAIVMLGMVFEGIVVDHGLSHAIELGLSGPPSMWAMNALVESIFDGNLSDKERAAFNALMKGRELLRPALQLEQPMVVNKAMLVNLEAFVSEVANRVGLGVGQGTA